VKSPTSRRLWLSSGSRQRGMQKYPAHDGRTLYRVHRSLRAEALASSLVLCGLCHRRRHRMFQLSFFLHVRLLLDRLRINLTLTGHSHLRCTSPPQHHEQEQGPPTHFMLRGATRALPLHTRLDCHHHHLSSSTNTAIPLDFNVHTHTHTYTHDSHSHSHNTIILAVC